MTTWGDVMEAMKTCTTKEQADALVAKIVAETTAMTETGRREAALNSIGYMTGYFSRAEAGRLLALFETKHPFFGAIEQWPENPDEIVRMGMEYARKWKETKQ